MSEVDRATDIVRHAGGRIVGRTRLQKIAYVLECAGLGAGFSFSYRHYGPYSEDLAAAVRRGVALGKIIETEHHTGWGGVYSIFSAPAGTPPADLQARGTLEDIGVGADAIELELAATALFFAKSGSADPWKDTEKHKPEKARDGRLARAKALYAKLRSVRTPRPLPAII